MNFIIYFYCSVRFYFPNIEACIMHNLYIFYGLGDESEREKKIYKD